MKYKEIIRDIAAAGLLVCSFWNILYPEYHQKAYYLQM